MGHAPKYVSLDCSPQARSLVAQGGQLLLQLPLASKKQTTPGVMLYDDTAQFNIIATKSIVTICPHNPLSDDAIALIHHILLLLELVVVVEHGSTTQ